jgi:cysteine desulfurase
VRSIYFDYNATTPLDPGVRDGMMPCLEEVWGNPSSVHHMGRRARALLDDARDRVAHLWSCKPSEVVFTSGGTESSNLAIFGVVRLLQGKGRHIITSQVEHHAVLHACDYLSRKERFEVTQLPVDAEGHVAPASLEAALRPDTVLVSVMAANNEVGSVQCVRELGAICRQRGVLFHTDAVQSFGKIPFQSIHDFNADLVSVCAHKFHGPKGAGALYIRSPLRPDPILFGGAHEHERRAGTENLSAIVGLVIALERFIQPPVFSAAHLEPLANRLRQLIGSLSDSGVTLRGPVKGGLVNTVAFSVRNTDSLTLLAALDLEGICASSGSACSAGSIEPSHVLRALGVAREESTALVRFSLGRESTPEEVTVIERVLPEITRRAQQAK